MNVFQKETFGDQKTKPRTPDQMVKLFQEHEAMLMVGRQKLRFSEGGG